MAGLLATELMQSLQIYEYRKCIPYIAYGIGMSRAEFSARDDYNRWQVDTSITFRGKRCKTLNPDFLFSVFSRYSGDEPQIVRALMIKWIHENREQFDKATFIGMTGKDIELDQWLIDMESPRTIGDEFALFALCKLFNRHARVLNRGNTWHSVSIEGSHDEQFIEKACDVHLLYLAKDTIAELKRKTTGAVPTNNPITVPNITRPLGLHNMQLPVAPITTLPDETPASDEPSKIVLIPDYVTTIGGIVSLPKDAIDIPENLIQRDNFDDPVENANIKQPDIPNQSKANDSQQTMPCSVPLRRLSHSDVFKWQKQKLQDATDTDLDIVNQNYYLRDQNIKQNRVSSRPQRTVCKLPVYTDPTDDSSQDSQVIGKIYFNDIRPLPDEKLEKIVGLSEPSAYRMGAQNFITAKRRGELPAPPTQTLPGFKSKVQKSKEAGETPDVNDSTDSNATIIYTPPKLPDRTDSSHKIKGKLHIKRLSLRKARPMKKGHRLFRCIRCSMLFNTIAELNDHFISKHRKLTCKVCDKSFYKPRSYQKHLYVHKDSKHVCITCGKGFAFKSQLDAHMPVHSGTRIHLCPERNCSKRFTHSGDLKKHVKTHSKKWWRCEVAGCNYKKQRLSKSKVTQNLPFNKEIFCVQILWKKVYVEHAVSPPLPGATVYSS